MVEAPGSAPGSATPIPHSVYHHSWQASPLNIGASRTGATLEAASCGILGWWRSMRVTRWERAGNGPVQAGPEVGMGLDEAKRAEIEELQGSPLTWQLLGERGARGGQRRDDARRVDEARQRFGG